MNRLFIAAAAALLCAGSASAGVHFTIDRTGDSTATISGSGSLDGDLFDVVTIRFVNPNPLILADDGAGDTITGDLALGSAALDTAALSTQGLGQLQFNLPSPQNFAAGDAASGSGDVAFNIELIMPEGTQGVVEVLFAGAPTPPRPASAAARAASPPSSARTASSPRPRQRPCSAWASSPPPGAGAELHA